MFFTDKEKLIKSLSILQKEKCCYSGGNTCDCKYGYPGQIINGAGEQTCCPELSSVIEILSNMTNEEYENFCRRE